MYGIELIRAKKILRQLPACSMTFLLYGLISLDRKIRALRTGSEFVISGEEAEREMPENPEPDPRLADSLQSLDVECEISRRRALYAGIEEAVSRQGGIPVFPELLGHVVPYGFAFRAPRDSMEGIKKILKRHYIDCHAWPELPTGIGTGKSGFYESVQLVNFIW